jgi:hypothetical protein
MLPARNTNRAAPSVEPDEEITSTSVGPVATNILFAVMSMRRGDSAREQAEVGADPTGPESGFQERCSNVSTPGICDLIPTEDVLDRWFDALHQGPPAAPAEAQDDQADTEIMVIPHMLDTARTSEPIAAAVDETRAVPALVTRTRRPSVALANWVFLGAAIVFTAMLFSPR